MTNLEIAITTVDDAVNAQAGGAHSIELSYDLSVGGLTPERQVMQATRDAMSIPMYTIIRPHAESFHYVGEEIAGIMDEIEVMKSIGVDGVVFGAVDKTGTIDVEMMKHFTELAAPISMTLHRALDESVEPEKALAALAGIVPRVLTSGPAPTAWEGRDMLKLWVERFGQQIQFIGAGSLTVDQLPDYIAWVKPHTVHVGSAAKTNGVVDVAKVRQLRAIIDEYGE
jgi:copper homeostasis protein